MRNLLSKELVFSVGRASFPFNFFPSFFFFLCLWFFKSLIMGLGVNLEMVIAWHEQGPGAPPPAQEALLGAQRASEITQAPI